MQQRRFFIQSAISTILMIIAVGNVGCKADDKKKVDFVFVVERAPLYTYLSAHVADTPGTDKIFGTLFFSIKRWVNRFLMCMEQARWVNDNFNASYSGFILEIMQDKLERPAPFTYSVKKMRDSYVKMIYSVHKETKPDPNRLPKTEAAVKKVRDAIRRPVERQGVPVIIVWHVTFQPGWYIYPEASILHLMKAKNGPNVVFAFQGQPESDFDYLDVIMYTCIDCAVPRKIRFVSRATDCDQIQPHVNAIFALLGNCETVATYSKCYYNDTLHCVVDVAYGPEEGTEEKYLKYCWTGESNGVECKDGKQACEALCDQLMTKSACSVTCGNGTMKVERPTAPDKFTRNCPERVLPCDGPPCPGQTPATRRRVTTAVGTTTMAGTVSTFSRSPATTPTSATPEPGGILKPWMIAVMAVCAVALLAILIGVIVYFRRRRTALAEIINDHRPPSKHQASSFYPTNMSVACAKNAPSECCLRLINRIAAGCENRTTILRPAKRKVVAFHEAGHAVAAWFLKGAATVAKVSIIPEGDSLGYTEYLLTDENIFFQSELTARICVLFGGRVAEEMFSNKDNKDKDISTCLHQDVQEISRLARLMVEQLTMSKPIESLSITRNQAGASVPIGGKLRDLADDEVHTLTDDCLKRTRELLEKHESDVVKVAKLLLEKDVIWKADLEKILGPPLSSVTEDVATEDEDRPTHVESKDSASAISKSRTEFFSKADQVGANFPSTSRATACNPFTQGPGNKLE